MASQSVFLDGFYGDLFDSVRQLGCASCIKTLLSHSDILMRVIVHVIAPGSLPYPTPPKNGTAQIPKLGPGPVPMVAGLNVLFVVCATRVSKLGSSLSAD
jgi:hypothetical protein